MTSLPEIPGAVEEVMVISKGKKIAKVIQENQLATAVGLFVLWQFGLLGDAISYIGC